MVKSKGSKKSNILSCSSDKVVIRSSTKVDGRTIRKGTTGTLVKQRKTPSGYGRATVNFPDVSGNVELATSKLKCK